MSDRLNNALTLIPSDVEPPTFINCPSSPVSVSYMGPAGFAVPSAQDNSGSVRSITVSPSYFFPTQPIPADINVTYTAMDHASLTAECVVNIVIRGKWQLRSVLPCLKNAVHERSEILGMRGAIVDTGVFNICLFRCFCASTNIHSFIQVSMKPIEHNCLVLKGL